MAVTITLPPPLSAEIDSLRAQLSVVRAQTASDRALIVELRDRLTEARDCIDDATRAPRVKWDMPALVAKYDALLGKVAP